jgi:hypothetical protein
MPDIHDPTEDEDYLISNAIVDDFAIEDESTSDVSEEEQTVETKLIQEIRTYLDEAEKEHNTFDIIDLTEQAKMNPTQQIAVHKQVVAHLRNIRNTINNKVREN